MCEESLLWWRLILIELTARYSSTTTFFKVGS